MRLVAFTGLPRSGKDTAAAYLMDRHAFYRRQFSTPLKQAAAVLLDRTVDEMEGANGFDREAILPEWGFSTRWFLQRLGTECMRDVIGPDFWLKRMRKTLSPIGRYVITDLRFQNEVSLVRDLGGRIIEIARPGVERSVHISDAGVEADWIIPNTGTIDELHTLVAHAVFSAPSLQSARR